MNQEKQETRRNRHDSMEKTWLRIQQDRSKELRNYFTGNDSIKRLLIPLSLLLLVWLLQELGLLS